MIQRIQTLWMAVTTALMCVVFFMPALYFSLGGEEFKLMTYGIKGVSGIMLVHDGAVNGSLVTSTLSICVAVIVGLAALVPFVAIFLYKKRSLQIRLLTVEFILLLGSAGFLAYYIWITHRDIVAAMSSNFYFSFYPLMIVIAMFTNWFAVRGVVRDDLLVRSVDRIR